LGRQRLSRIAPPLSTFGGIPRFSQSNFAASASDRLTAAEGHVIRLHTSAREISRTKQQSEALDKAYRTGLDRIPDITKKQDPWEKCEVNGLEQHQTEIRR
jgi:hypothetical protein